MKAALNSTSCRSTAWEQHQSSKFIQPVSRKHFQAVKSAKIFFCPHHLCIYSFWNDASVLHIRISAGFSTDCSLGFMVHSSPPTTPPPLPSPPPVCLPIQGYQTPPKPWQNTAWTFDKSLFWSYIHTNHICCFLSGLVKPVLLYGHAARSQKKNVLHHTWFCILQMLR